MVVLLGIYRRTGGPDGFSVMIELDEYNNHYSYTVCTNVDRILFCCVFDGRL